MFYSLMMICSLNKDFSKVTFITNQFHILVEDLDKDKNPDEDKNFDEDNPGTIFHVRVLAWCKKFEKRKAYKKEIMTVAWHHKR